MARVSDNLLPDGVVMGVTLDRYQELVQFIPMAAFNGLAKADDDDCYDCTAIWTQEDRDALALALVEAEEMREHELGYWTFPKYIDDEEYDYGHPVILDSKYLIAMGSKACSDIEDAVALTLGDELTPNDPVEFTVATTVTDTSEITLYYPDEDVEIHPTSVVISGGIATIQVPRSRLIDPSIDLNCIPAPNYYENDNFLTTIDVKRCYTDLSDGAFFTWFGSSCCCNVGAGIMSLTETTQLTYPKITDSRLSIVRLYPATYDGTDWTGVRITKCRTPDSIRASYLSGIRSSVQVEMNTVKLAHTLFSATVPERLNICSVCWKNDREPDPSDLVTPYGMATGAVKVWLADSRAKVGQGGKFPRVMPVRMY